MVVDDNHGGRADRDRRRAANIRLAVILGLIALTFYIGMLVVGPPR